MSNDPTATPTPARSDTPTPQIHRIAPDCPPQFPCWLWQPDGQYWTKWHLTGYRGTEWRELGHTHWASVYPSRDPDQPTAPTQRPDELTPMSDLVLRGAPSAATLNLNTPPTPAQSAPKITAEHDGTKTFSYSPHAQPATPRTDAACGLAAGETPETYRGHKACVGIVPTDFARTLETELAAKDAELVEKQKEIDDWIAATSAAQKRIVALEGECERLKLDLENLHGRIGLFAEKWWIINNNLSTDETFKQMEEQIVDVAQKYTYLMNDRDQLRAENATLRGLLGEAMNALESDKEQERYNCWTTIRAALAQGGGE